MFLLIRTQDITRTKWELNNIAITQVKPGDEVFVNIRRYGHEWYEQLNLPDWEFKRYVVAFQYIDYPIRNATNHKRINTECKIFRDICNSTQQKGCPP
jgi:hypothetical protein